MNHLIPLALAACLALGCGTWKQYDPSVLIDGEPALIASGRFGGQGQLSVTKENGVTTIEVVQFGVSDVLGGTIKGIVGAFAGVFGGNAEPPAITINNMPAPTDLEPATPHTRYLMSPVP